MLTQQSPRYICRVCLAAQSRSGRCRQVTQIRRLSTQSTEPTQNSEAAANVDESQRRIPLRELIERRKLESQLSAAEPLEESFNPEEKANGQQSLGEKNDANTGESEKSQELSKESNKEKMTPPTKHAPSARPKKFSMNLFRKIQWQSNTQKQPHHNQKRAPTSSSTSTTQQSSPTDSSTSTPSASTATTESLTPISDAIQSRRSKRLETPDIPLPSAPTTKLRTKPLRPTRRVIGSPDAVSPLARARAYQVTQTSSDPKIHPGDPINSHDAFPGTAVRDIVTEEIQASELDHRDRIWSEDIKMTPVQPKELRPVPTLEHGLDRVLFNPGVTYLRDPRSLVYNFDPYLENIMPMEEFDYDALYEYITSSRDTTLVDMAKQCGASYVGSTSSMTAVLSHFHFLLSAWRPVNIDMLSTSFATQFRSFTAISRAPAGIFLRYKGDGVYAIDADKMYDTNETVLSWLGRSMEKMLTLPPEQMEKFRKSVSHTLEPHERGQPEAYHYTNCGTILMRSQLDCNDGRLPGTGVFDLKTRACISVRMDVQNASEGADYEIHHLTGVYNSFEREYYDMIRSAFLKYSLQVRIGHMDGIFVAYHNTKRIFGFQYIPLGEMDTAIHGSGNNDTGRREFQFSIKLLNETLDRAVRRFPRQSLRLTFETRDTKVPQMYIMVEPYEESEIDAIQTGEYIQALRLAEERARAEEQETAEISEETQDQLSVEDTSASNPDSTEPEARTSISEDEDDLEETSSTAESIFNVSDRELLAMVLKTQNYINGKLVTGPPIPNAEDKWEMTYTYETLSPDRARRVHQMSTDRRRKALDEEFREQALEENVTSQKSKEWNRGFLLHLKELSTRGKAWREEFERTAGRREKVVWHEGKPPSKHGTVAWKEGKQQN